MTEIDQIAFEPPDLRRPGIVAGTLVEAQPELPLEPRQPADPPVVAADDRRLDQQPVPVPGRAQRPLDDRPVVGVGQAPEVRVVVVRIEVGDVEQRSLHRQGGRRQHLIGLGGRHPTPAAGRRRAFRIGWRHLPSERYSENRRADRCSAAHASRARNARPAGSGARVPRTNHASTPARRKAVSSNAL